MTTVNIHEAKTHLSRLVDRAARGETFVIAKAGKPLVRVSAIDTPAAPQRLGFLEGEISVPEDFNEMGAESIVALFGGDMPGGDVPDDDMSAGDGEEEPYAPERPRHEASVRRPRRKP